MNKSIEQDKILIGGKKDSIIDDFKKVSNMFTEMKRHGFQNKHYIHPKYTKKYKNWMGRVMAQISERR